MDQNDRTVRVSRKNTPVPPVPARHLVAIRQDGEANGHIGMRKFAAAARHILRYVKTAAGQAVVNVEWLYLMLMIVNVHLHDSYNILYIVISCICTVYVLYMYCIYIYCIY